jgi:gliding motility-associated-like protein
MAFKKLILLAFIILSGQSIGFAQTCTRTNIFTEGFEGGPGGAHMGLGTGATSSYNCCRISSGSYEICSDATACIGAVPVNWKTAAATPHSGKYAMVVDGNCCTATTNVWCRSVTLTNNAIYNFAAYVGSPWAEEQSNDLIVSLTIGGTSISSLLVEEYKNSPAGATPYQLLDACNYKYTGATGPVNVCIVMTEQTVSWQGNDIMLDDIKFDEISGTCSTISVAPGPDPYLCKAGANTRNITVSDTGVYSVMVKNGSCDFYGTVSVHFYPEITAKVLGEDTTVCAGYVIKTDTVFSSYQWQDGSHAPSYTPASTGLYSVRVSNPEGCKSDSIFVTVNQNPTPHIITAKEDKIFCTDSSVVLDAGSGYAHYTWMNGDTNEIYSGRHINEDKYWVTVTDFNKCSAADTFQTDCSIYIESPNLITPNGDSLNDAFFIKGLRPGKWSMEIFNRWGGRVYYNKAYDNTWNGKNDSDGIYYYHLRHIKGIVNYKGWVQIWGKE